MPDDFVHLHVHSTFSLFDSVARIPDLLSTAAELKMGALALTDHNVLFGAVEFTLAAKAAGIKALIGCELNLMPLRSDPAAHLTVLVQNSQGYRNLCRIVSAAHLQRSPCFPSVELSFVSKNAEGLIALSGCLKGEVARLLLDSEIDRAVEVVTFYHDLFGPDRFYLELQDHGIPEQAEVNLRLAEFSEDFGIPLVATNNVHYVRPEDYEALDVLLSIPTDRSEDNRNLRFFSPEYYLKSSEEMRECLGSFPGALETTLRIAEICNFEMDMQTAHLPPFICPGSFKRTEIGGSNEGVPVDDHDAYLRWKCEQAIPRLYPVPTPELFDRLNYELKVIALKGFSAFFLVVEDIIQFARSQGIHAGARGSVAGSLVAYLLGFTSIDPLEWGLVFERFLVPGRVTPPDIDVDFQNDRRDEIFQYVNERYGSERVARIIALNKTSPRGAVREGARALGLPPDYTGTITKLLPRHGTIEEAIATRAEVREKIFSDPVAARLLETAKPLIGLPRHPSQHPCGVVITADPLSDLLPLYRMPDGTIVTQYNFEDVEKAGFIKLDLLGLIYYAVVNECQRLILETTGKSLDIQTLPLRLPERNQSTSIEGSDSHPLYPMASFAKTYRMIQRAETLGIFLLESDGMRILLRDLYPTEFNDLIAVSALYRPGPLSGGMTLEYVRRKQGWNRVRYFDESVEPLVKPFLKRTFGLLVYQEQVMQIASVLAGFTPIEADDLRKAMSKKTKGVMQRLRPVFVTQARKRGVPERVAVHIFETMAAFSQYAFALNHAAAYSILTWQTSWLKANFPVEYMAARLTGEIGYGRISLYIAECRRLGIKILPPCINHSRKEFSVEDGSIRFALAALHGLGGKALEHILEIRQSGPFAGYEDLLSRVDPAVVHRDALEALIDAGAMDSIHSNRRALSKSLSRAQEFAHAVSRNRASQLSLFDLENAEAARQSLGLDDIPDYDIWEILSKEKARLGVYVSNHPLNLLKERLEPFQPTPIQHLVHIDERTEVAVAGLVSQISRNVDRVSLRESWTSVLEDETGIIKVVFAKEGPHGNKSPLRANTVVVVRGRVRIPQELRPKEAEYEVVGPPAEVSLMVEEILALFDIASACSEKEGMEMIDQPIRDDK